MKEIALELNQSAFKWSRDLIGSIPFELWEMTPVNIESNVSWQVGHLILAQNYHGITSIVGFQKELLAEIPISEYAKVFGFNTTPAEVAGKVKPQELIEHIHFIQDRIIEVIESVDDKDLLDAVIEQKRPHPIAKTKLDSLIWNAQHTMWHNGQLGLIRRAIAGKHDFFKHTKVE